jgi:hypothetical protein
VILAWPLLLVIASFVAKMRRGEQGGRGWLWFLAWNLAGFLMSFSLITGFSIGLFILPLAAATLLWVSWSAPHLREASGFAAGIGETGLLIFALSG